MDDHGSNTSFVSKAKIVIHSAAAKAERVIKDFKSDLGLFFFIHFLCYPFEFYVKFLFFLAKKYFILWKWSFFFVGEFVF
jgi:hypothetical protein